MFNIVGRSDSASEIKQINPEEALKIIEKNKGAKTIILDVREPHEFKGNLGHIKNAMLVPLKLLSLKAKELEKHKEDDIIVVCHSGIRSHSACNILKRHGFKNVYNLKGGMILWKRLGLDSHND